MKVLKISKGLEKYIKNHINHKATVHSVFDEAFNIIDPKGVLITFLSKKKDLSPMSAITNMTPRDIWSIHQDDDVEITDYGITFLKNRRTIRLEQYKVKDLHFNIKDKENASKDIKDKLIKLKEIIKKKGIFTGITPLIFFLEFSDDICFLEFDENCMNEYCNFIHKQLLNILKAINDEAYEQVLELIPSFVGFGPGLTPSSDDFLAGMIIAYYYHEYMFNEDFSEKDSWIKDVYQLSIGKTTKVSETMLEHASNGIVSNHYRELIRSIYIKVDKPFETYVERVINNGSSSGTDFLFGVYCINMILMNLDKKEAFPHGQI